MITFKVNKNVEKYFNEVIKDMNEATIPYDVDNVIKVEYKNSKTNRGTCIRVRDDIDVPKYTIQISKYLKDEWDIKSIIVHEMLHTGIFDQGHSNVFFYYIDKMHKYDNRYLRLYGGTGKQSSKSDKLNCAIEYKYTVKCKCCGHEYGYSRKATVMTNPENCRCGHCNSVGKFEVIQNY